MNDAHVWQGRATKISNKPITRKSDPAWSPVTNDDQDRPTLQRGQKRVGRLGIDRRVYATSPSRCHHCPIPKPCGACFDGMHAKCVEAGMEDHRPHGDNVGATLMQSGNGT